MSSSLKRAAPLPPPGIDLGHLLVEEGLVDDEAVSEARRIAARSQTPLAEVVLARRLVGEEALIRLLRRRLGLSGIDLDSVAVDLDALRLLPLEAAERLRALPLGLDDSGPRRILRVAVSDPLDGACMGELERATGCRIEPVVASVVRLPAAVERVYRDMVTKVIPRRRSTPPGVLSPVTQETPPPAARPRTVYDTLDEQLPAEGAKPAAPGSPRFVEVPTRPMHSVPAEADLAIRLDALVTLLLRKGLLAEEEFAEEVRRLLKARHDES